MVAALLARLPDSVRRRWPVWAGTYAGLILVLGTTGPFGTFQSMDLGPRLLYWALAVGLGGAICGFPTWIAMIRWGSAERFRLLPVLLPALASLPVLGLALYGLTVAFGMPPDAFAGFMQAFLLAGLPLGVGMAVLMAWLGWSMGARAAGPAAPTTAGSPADPAAPHAGPPSAPTAESAAPAAPMAPERTPFYERVPARLAGKLLALANEDHYLRIYTDRGSDLILLRMADAERELAGSDGLRVHRSYWVAGQAVIDAEREAGRAQLHLSNGLTVPVSRSYLAAVRAAGWLDT